MTENDQSAVFKALLLGLIDYPHFCKYFEGFVDFLLHFRIVTKQFCEISTNKVCSMTLKISIFHIIVGSFFLVNRI